ncbi:hypothetical protein FA95DRAFT_1498000 [Auriscalpium vulgare]|uniref:Uncharacterized protein n=1 Tax=Auriscalpium vulgare TaxID=40419 RepID=A0ACB8RHZ5_9AGAM|nr:hypothetical protein FA95DRAFT_1498000 [Auriscalpium vulgare]
MSEQSIILRSQPSLNTSVVSGNPPLGLTQLSAKAKSKPRFAEFACSNFEASGAPSPSMVFRFAVLATKAVIPQALWGSKENFKSVMEGLFSRF